jgi:hypothetical protein
MSIQLSPDMEAGLRAEAAARGVSVDALVAEAVGSYLKKNGGPGRIRSVPFQERRAEMAWAAKPDPQYVGKWVVLEGSEVLAAGADPKAIYEEVRAKRISSPFLIYVSPEEQEPFAGGWLD